MKITEPMTDIKCSAVFPVRKISTDGSLISLKDNCLLIEYALSVFSEGKLLFKAVCTPTCLKELIVGRLITESGIFPDDIEQIEIFPEEGTANVILHKKPNKKPEPTQLTGSSDYLCAVSALNSKVKEDSGLHVLTGASHSSMLVYEDKVLFEAEDLGRHNAIDKAVGFLYINGLDPSKAALFTTGRMPEDMVRKALMARIPVFISKKKPTAAGLSIAAKYNLRLIGSLRDDHMEVYN